MENLPPPPVVRSPVRLVIAIGLLAGLAIVSVVRGCPTPALPEHEAQRPPPPPPAQLTRASPPPAVPKPLPPLRADADGLATLSGHVLASDSSKGIEGCAVRLGTATDARDALQTETDESGAFELRAEPGHDTLAVKCDDWLPSEVEGIVVSAGEDIRGLDVRVDRGRTIAGSVGLPPDLEGDPPSGVLVGVQDDWGAGWIRVRQTDDHGNFSFGGLPQGRFTVTAFDRFLGEDHRHVQAGTEDVRLVLAKRQHLRGTVFRSDGGLAIGAAIFLDVKPPFDNRGDLDPIWGEEDPVVSGPGSFGCSPAPECYRDAITDGDGGFDVDAPDALPTLLSASLDGERATMANPRGSACVLRLLPHRAHPERIPPGWVFGPEDAGP